MLNICGLFSGDFNLAIWQILGELPTLRHTKNYILKPDTMSMW